MLGWLVALFGAWKVAGRRVEDAKRAGGLPSSIGNENE